MGILIYTSFIVYLLIINTVAYACFVKDKHHAKAGKRRISEHHLMLLAWLGGGVGARMAMRRHHHKTHHWRFRLGVPVTIIVWLLPFISVTSVFVMQRGEVLTTVFMMHRALEAERENKPYAKDYRWVDYDEIQPSLTRAVIASEDNLFAQHNGFSERGLRQAWKELTEKGKVRHGGSTISQQTAKNVFTTGNRTWYRKIRETWYTVLIETFWSKRRIMEVYLNVIEMGNGIYGAEAASQRYFHHSAERLNNAQSALIAASLPNPRKYSVTCPGPYMQLRQGQILNLMPKMGKIEL
ncbi:MAG: monofunctional biosynthetic peptidoglycan transglycosylase [Paludibacteraceae bacterium]|nr:monofunctional biosynthetic peptidoglycan transglycosylase [Paludibacteraceae bacterium]